MEHFGRVIEHLGGVYIINLSGVMEHLSRVFEDSSGVERLSGVIERIF